MQLRPLESAWHLVNKPQVGSLAGGREGGVPGQAAGSVATSPPREALTSLVPALRGPQ